MKIDIAKCTAKSRVTREDGQRLREMVQKKWNSEIFEFDFCNVTVASVSFLDEVFGYLTLEKGLDEIKKKVRVKNITDFDRRLLNDIVYSRSKQKRNW
ncbi:STAS-like domain-containing protein [candidate division WOR-3 bacterium]|nr:STAS-like domain-containing protein [candidate division WOR-3 bacterium]